MARMDPTIDYTYLVYRLSWSIILIAMWINKTSESRPRDHLQVPSRVLLDNSILQQMRVWYFRLIGRRLGSPTNQGKVTVGYTSRCEGSVVLYNGFDLDG